MPKRAADHNQCSPRDDDFHAEPNRSNADLIGNLRRLASWMKANPTSGGKDVLCDYRSGQILSTVIAGEVGEWIEEARMAGAFEIASPDWQLRNKLEVDNSLERVRRMIGWLRDMSFLSTNERTVTATALADALTELNRTRPKRATTVESVTDVSAKMKRPRRGRQPKYDAAIDKRIADAWETNEHRTHADLAISLKVTRSEVVRALDRVRKRRNKSR